MAGYKKKKKKCFGWVFFFFFFLQNIQQIRQRNMCKGHEILPACRAEWPTWQLGLLAQAQPPPLSELLLPWHFPYSQGTRVPHPAGVFSHTSVPCFPIQLYYREKRNGRFTKGQSLAHWIGILLFSSENSHRHIQYSNTFNLLTVRFRFKC